MEIKHISLLPYSESQVTRSVAFLILVIREVESKEIAAAYLSAHRPHKRECSQIQQIADAAADVKDMVREMAEEVNKLRDVDKLTNCQWSQMCPKNYLEKGFSLIGLNFVGTSDYKKCKLLCLVPIREPSQSSSMISPNSSFFFATFWLLTRDTKSSGACNASNCSDALLWHPCNLPVNCNDMSISHRLLPAAGSRHSQPGCNYKSDGSSYSAT